MILPIINAIASQRLFLPKQQGMLVAISGIDASGKGYLAVKIVTMLLQKNLRVATINIDGWLNLPKRRFSQTNPGEHFYYHAIRFDELFTKLVLPLRQNRSISLEIDYAEETATKYRPRRYEFADIDIIILEGIFLLKTEFQSYYDLSFWVECTWDTALNRAMARSQEGLSPEATIQVYQTIYFPAQKIHLKRGKPKQAATAIIDNDRDDINDIILIK
jgi:uridine kinase